MPVTISSIFYFFLLYFLCEGAKDPVENNYCDFDDSKSRSGSCKNETRDVDAGAHPACECATYQNRKEIFANDEEQMKAFRKNITKLHNKLRNSFAGGKEAKKGFKYAADMMALSYDLTLERFARCRAMGTLFVNSTGMAHEPCRWMGVDREHPTYYGQNVYGATRITDTLQYLEVAVTTWYNEYTNVDNVDLMDALGYTPTVIGHFTQMVWSRLTRVGCVLVHMPDSKSEVYQYTLLCNYHGINGASGNFLGDYVYKRVDSVDQTCTNCYDGTKCTKNSSFPYLCGAPFIIKTLTEATPNQEQQPATTEDSEDQNPRLEDGCVGNTAGKIVISLVFVVIALFY